VRAGCRSVAYTCNDPVIFLEYAVDVAEACRARGVRNVAVSAGYVCAGARAELFRPMDAANIDLKAITAGFYRKLCTGALQPVLDTLVYLRHETRVWLEVTTLLIPGHNDDPAEIAALYARFVEHLGADVPLHFSAFHPTTGCWTCRAPRQRPCARRAASRSRTGLRHVYTGNVQNPSGQSTWCHGCGRRLIGRDGYAITGRALAEDCRCRSCGTRCPGVLEPRPGSWGPRRMPLAVAASPSPATVRDQGVGPAD
jgi:pyruvate formate lyase activating enzyme